MRQWNEHRKHSSVNQIQRDGTGAGLSIKKYLRT